MLQTSSLLVLTATEARPQYGQYGGASVYYPPSNPAVLQPSATAPLYSAVDVGRKKMKAAEEYIPLVDNLDNFFS